MSWQAVTWVLEESRATLGARLVLLSVASHANREGCESWPALNTIARETRMSRRQVIRCVHTLEASGELRVVLGGHRSGDTNHYELPHVEGWLAALANRRGDKLSPPRNLGRVTSAARSVTSTLEGVTSATERGDTDVTQTVLERSPKQMVPQKQPKSAPENGATASAACERAFYVLGKKPFGPANFQAAWTEAFEGQNGDGLTDLMEKAAQTCQERGVPVPALFFKLKRRAEDLELEQQFRRTPL